MAAPHPLLLPLLRGDDLPAMHEVTMDVVTSAEEHHVAALVEQAVAERSLAVSDSVRARLVAHAIAAEAENRAAEAAASQINDVAVDLNMEVAVFKGPSIGSRFYDAPRRRPSVDLDVFIDPAEQHRLGKLVTALGDSDDSTATINAMVKSGRVFETNCKVGGTMVDIHRDPMNMIVVASDESERWARMTHVTTPDGTRLQTLDLEDTTIQALLNLFRDNFADLLHINDVRLMIDAEPDWDEVQWRVDVNGWTALVRYALWFVSDQLGRPSPLPTTIERWQKRAIESIWPRELLLKGSESHARSLRRQSAAGILVSGRPVATARAYGQRLLPPRAVIDHRSGQTEGSYAAALVRWRLAQRRENTAFRDASYRDGQ